MASDVTTTSDAPEVDVNSVKHTLRMAIMLCLACSVLVSFAAVGLKTIQDGKKKAFREENILKAAGLWDDNADPAELMSQIEAVVVDMETGDATVDEAEADRINQKIRKIVKDPTQSDEIADDIAGIRRREQKAVVYRITESGKLKTVILPIRGYGLWSTLWGFVALDMTDAGTGPDKIFITGLTFYEQKETPGLGGEVDNPKWKAKWPGKKAFDANWKPKIAVKKSAEGIYAVDALSGATITSRGVSNMLKYWLGDEGFGPYLRKASGAAPEAHGEPADGSAGAEAAEHKEEKPHDSNQEHEEK